MPPDAELLERFRPVLQYDSHELYYADSAATLTDNAIGGGPMAPYANVLRRKDKSVVATAGGGPLALDFLGDLAYADGRPVREGDFLDAATQQYVADARRMHADSGYADRVYDLSDLPEGGAEVELQRMRDPGADAGG